MRTRVGGMKGGEQTRGSSFSAVVRAVVRFVSLKPPSRASIREGGAPRFLVNNDSFATERRLRDDATIARDDPGPKRARSSAISDNEMRALDASYAVFMRAPRLMGKDKKPSRPTNIRSPTSDLRSSMRLCKYCHKYRYTSIDKGFLSFHTNFACFTHAEFSISIGLIIHIFFYQVVRNNLSQIRL